MAKLHLKILAASGSPVHGALRASSNTARASCETEICGWRVASHVRELALHFSIVSIRRPLCPHRRSCL